MKTKFLAFLTSPVIAGAFFVSTVSAHYTETEHDHPYTPDLQITSPTAGSTVPTVFTLRGTVEPNCTMDSTVSLQDNTQSGYIDVTPARSGNTYSYSIDTSKVLTREGLDPYTLKNGKIAIYVYVDYQDSDCRGTEANPDYKEIILNLQHPGTPPPPQAQKKQIDAPRTAVTPSPSPTPVAVSESPAVAVEGSFWEKLDPQWWLLIGVLAGMLALGGAEWTAHAYHKRHKKK